MKVILKQPSPMNAVVWNKMGDHDAVLDYHHAWDKGFRAESTEQLDSLASVNNESGFGLLMVDDKWEVIKPETCLVELQDGSVEAYSKEEFLQFFDVVSHDSIPQIPADYPYARVTNQKTSSVIESRNMFVAGHILVNQSGDTVALSFNQAVRWSTPDEMFQFIHNSYNKSSTEDPELNRTMVPVSSYLLNNLEILGVQCADTGKCHHSCTEESGCFRKSCASPLSMAEPWLNDDWTQKHK